MHLTGSIGSMNARTLLHHANRMTPSPAGVLVGILGLAIALQPLTGLAQTHSTVWHGSGRVVSGQGEGASVHLVLETTPNRIRTQSGPTLDASFSGGQQTVKNEAGTWQIESHGDRLGVTLYRDNQIIRYQLLPSPSKGNSEKSQSFTASAPKGHVVANALFVAK